MFGIQYASFDAATHVLHYQKGRIVREGRGLSFFYFAPTSSIVAIPVSSNDLPFIFSETTLDYQTVNIQGQITFKVGAPEKLADILDFTIDSDGRYKKNDMEKLNQRIINEAHTSISAFIHSIGLKEAIRSAKAAETRISESLMRSEAIKMLGIDILAASILAINATPEMTRALETETRERLQQEADQAIYERRNFAVEQERKIKESELNTEIAVEEKKKQKAEKQAELKVQEAENERKLREMLVQADISVENQRKQFLEQKTANDKAEADARGYMLETTLKPYRDMDWRTLMALSGPADPGVNIALAFRQLAENADKIGNLNISPDLLESLLNHTQATQK
jgi:hypothetical protein